ncbi:MAG: amidohydrolase family protein [Coriobacteriia bacterium]|nr:amidohydrolase family protein [Coriobacteriia bacterium]
MILTAKYLLPVSSAHIENGAIRIVDDTIVAIGHVDELRAQYPDDELKNFGLAALMPGFVDAYTKLEYTAFRGILNDMPYGPWIAYITEKARLFEQHDWEISSKMGVIEAISSGITTIADASSHGASVGPLAQSGLRAIVYQEVGATSHEKVDEEFEEALARLDELRKNCSDLMDFGLAAAPLYICHPRMLKKLGEYGKDGARVAMQLSGSREEYAFIHDGTSSFALDSNDPKTRAISSIQSKELMPTGVSPVRYADNWGILDASNLLASYVVHVDDSDIKRLADRGVKVVVCPTATAKLAMGLAPIVKLRKAGITVALGTDSAAASDGLEMFNEMHFAMLAQRARQLTNDILVAKDMIEMATIDAARALAIDDKVGSLEVGKQADVIAIDLSNSHQIPTHYPNSAIVNTADSRNLLMTMVAGKILFDHGKFSSHIELEDTLMQAEQIRMKLRQ